MTQEEMLTALYEKMAAEQDKYRDWLKSQPAAEVLNHAYEYTVREDIVMCMEELELTEAQAKALLASPTPLADVYKDFEKLETSYMDVIRDTIETRANELYQAQEKLKNTPLYYDNGVPLDENISAAGAVESAEDTYFRELLADEIEAARKALCQERIAKVKALLTPRQYRRIWMYLAEGKSITEIAKTEGLSKASVSNSIAAALRKLRKLR